MNRTVAGSEDVPMDQVGEVVMAANWLYASGWIDAVDAVLVLIDRELKP